MTKPFANRKTLKSMLLAVLMVAVSTLNVWGQANKKTLFFISNSHLDTQWNWDVRVTIDEYIKNTMRQNFTLFDKYPNFQFNYEGAIKYMWMKEYYPDDFARLKTYIANGRWHVSGCSVDACDVMVSSAESIMRNWLYANQFYEREFGVRGGRDIMLPDCFGFPYSLPSLAAHCGQTGFHTAKLGWGAAGYDQLPPFGVWQGVDGSQIYAVYKPHAYDTHEEYNKDMSNDADMLNTINDNYSKYRVAAEVRYVGPRSDRGGGLRDDPNSSGENTPYWLNKSVEGTGPISVKLATPDEIFEYFDTYRNDRFHIHNSELPMRTHGVGAYTSRTMLKLWNRRNELLADAAEKSAALGQWLGVQQYPQQTIGDAWVKNIWQAHHDGITGTSIPKAYMYSMNDYVLVNKTLANVFATTSGAVISQMDTQAEGTAVVVYNPLSWQRTDIVEATLTTGSQPEGVRVFDSKGNEVLSQVNGYDSKTGELKLIFAATVPSMGYATYDIRLGTPSTLTSNLTVNTERQMLSNGEYQLTIDENGDISQLANIPKRRVVVSTASLQTIYDHEDAWPSWEISYTNVCRTPSPVRENVKVTLAEDGPLRKSYRVERTAEGSTFVQYVQMNALNNRVDCVSEVDWQSHGRMLKANVNTAFATTKATYDISLGTIERGNRNDDCYEVQGHQWADVTGSDNALGVSVLNNCKYGWDKPDNNNLRLTLIHTPSVSNNYTYQSEQDLGVNLFTYALFPHLGTWDSETQRQASQLNQPLMAFVAPKHQGTLGKEVTFVDVNTEKVAVKALKKAEQSDNLIVRLYEWSGEEQHDVTLTFPADVEAVREVNGLEKPVETSLQPYRKEGDKVVFDMKAYQPRTFEVTLKKPDTTVNPSEIVKSTPVDLAYNIDMMSYDGKRNDAVVTSVIPFNYPAELVPDVVNADGIDFKMGPKADGMNNVLRCRNQSIELEKSNGENKLYLLLASTNKQGTAAEIKVGEETYVLDVPYYAGVVGQLSSPFNIGTKYRKQDVALTASHCHRTSNSSNESYTFLYIYKYVLPLGSDANTLTLPNNSELLVFAATMANNQADDIEAATEINTYIEYKELSETDSDGCGELLSPRQVTASHYINNNETAAMAADMDETTKWCVGGNQSETPWLEYRFADKVDICQWMVLNAGTEDGGYITRDFKLQAMIDNEWKDIDVVTDNKSNKVVRGIKNTETTRVRLQIVQGEQNGTTTRIYEFAVYGKTADDTPVNAVMTSADRLAIDQLNRQGELRCSVPEGVETVTLHLLDIQGRQIATRNYKVTAGHNTLALPAVASKDYNPSSVVAVKLTAKTVKGNNIKSETKKFLIN